MAGSNESSPNLQQAEIEAVKSSFEGQVRVISGIGDFTNVVTILPDGLDIQCKFQLTENYPQNPPTISIRSSVLDTEQTASLIDTLQTEAASKEGHVMLAALMTSCKKWLNENDIDLSIITDTDKSKNKKGNKKSKKGNKTEKIKSENETLEKSDKKKPPMRTAADVIKRIQWDKAFDKENFVVGYIDRIVGLVEKNFMAFTWGDIAAADFYSLAIPQHRIQYFKYVTEKVWDKNERLDNVFGSTGSKLTLIEAVKKFEDKQRDLNEKSDENRKPGDDVTENADDEQSDEEWVDGTEEDESDQEDKIDEKTEAQANDSSKSRKRNQRPNFFVALQITDTETIEKLKDVQKQVMSWYPRYTDHIVPANGFHLTLSVLKLDSMSDKQACSEAMNQAKSELEKLARNTEPLIIQGLDHFSERVIYAKVKYTQNFIALVDEIREILIKGGFHVGSCSFKPHLTLFNVRRSVRLQRENILLNAIDESDGVFGSQVIDNIQVCRMGTLPTAESTEFYENIVHLKIN